MDRVEHLKEESYSFTLSSPFDLMPGELNLRSIEQLISSNIKLALNKSAYEKINKSRQILEDLLREGRIIYGINTGFGMLAHKKIPQESLKDLQKRIVLSHATGVGKALDIKAVKLIILLKINALARGYSGVRTEVIDALISLYNHEIYPSIPEKGSVGASGDLAPLAHLSMALLGEGDVFYKGSLVQASKALKEVGMTPLVLQEKEGLALLNGTQVSTAIALLGLFETMRNFSLGTIAGALSLDAAMGSLKPFHNMIAELKKCEGQKVYSQVVRSLLSESAILVSHSDTCEKVQDPYSLRCQPQVMGPIWRVIKEAAKNLVAEANSVSDNPLIIPETREVISGGNFHAEGVGFSADSLTMVASELGAISERRLALLIDTKLSGLPPFLVKEPGLNSGFMLAHVTASSLASENKTLAHPASVDSLPTSANQEDHVSMATWGARKLRLVSENVLSILVIETLAACQGLSLRLPLQTSSRLQDYFKKIRSRVPYYDQDRYFAKDINEATYVMTQRDYYWSVQKELFSDV